MFALIPSLSIFVPYLFILKILILIFLYGMLCVTY